MVWLTDRALGFEGFQNARAVSVDGYYSIHSAACKDIYDGFYAEGFAGQETLVLSAVSKVRNNRCYAPCFHVFRVICHEHQLQKPLVLGRACCLNNDDIFILE